MFFWYISLVYFCRLFPLPLAWLFDRWQGDPSWLPHPVVGFGKLIAWGEKCLNAGRARVWKGGMMSVALIVGVYFFTFLFFKVIGVFHHTDSAETNTADLLLPGRYNPDT